MRLPFTHAADFRRERDFGQKISATIDFIAGHWRPLGRVLLYFVLPAAILRSALSVLVQYQLPIQGLQRAPGQLFDATQMLAMQGNMWEAIFTSPAYWLNSLAGSIFFTVLLLSTYGYVLLLLERRTAGPPVTVAEVGAVLRREFVGTIFSLWAIGLLISAGFLFCIVPGVYLGVVFSLFFVVKLAEGTTVGETLRRCFYLMRQKWWSTFGLLLVSLLLFYIVLAGQGAIVVLLSGGLQGVFNALRDQSPWVTVFFTSIGSIATLLLYPPLLLVLAFQYFNLVERTDGTGMRLLVGSLGQTPAPQANSAAYRPDDDGEY